MKLIKVDARFRLEVYRDRSKQYRWRLRARNGRIVATGESHPRKRDAKRAFATVVSLILSAITDELRQGKQSRRRR